MSNSETPLLANTSSDGQRLLGAMNSAFRGEKINTDNCLPAIVQEYDRVNNVATVQILIQWVDVNDGLHSRMPMAGINVLSLGGGGFHINFPIKPGDLGWIFATDRDISLFKQSLSESRPNTGRLHKFEDGWFAPDVLRKYTINEADSAAMVIQSTNGLTRIAISEGMVKITAPTSTTVDSPLTTFTGNVVVEKNLTVDENTDIKQNLTVVQTSVLQSSLSVTGPTSVNGGFSAAGGKACSLPSSTTVAGIKVDTHGHTSNKEDLRTKGGMVS